MEAEEDSVGPRESTVEVPVPFAPAAPEESASGPDRLEGVLEGGRLSAFNAAVDSLGDGGRPRGETCTCCMNKKSADQKVGLEMGTSKDERWLLITKIHPGSLAHAHSVLREGAKLLAITVDGVVHRNPEVKQAARLISEAVGEIRITIQPLLDRYGFVVDVQDYTAGMATRGHVRVENEELRKWQKRVINARAWQAYTERQPLKLRQRIRDGVPDAVPLGLTPTLTQP